MRQLKILGLAAIAALGLMAFGGAGTASATTLSTDAAGATRYGAGTEIHATLKSGTSATLETTGGTVFATCTTSTAKGELEIVTGTWVEAAIDALTWGQEGGSCSQTTDTIAGHLGSLEIMQTTGDAGTVVGKGSEVTLGVFGVSCIYGTSTGTTLGTLTGGSAPELAINAVLPRLPGSNTFLCPTEGRWTATYVVTSPHEVHVIA